MADFLLEIGMDEIPARMIAGAEAELGRRVNDLLTRERLLEAGSKLTTYSTPRRLAVLVEGLLANQADSEEQLTGPSWNVAFKDGAPTKAAEAFAKKAGVDLSALVKVTNAKGEYVGATLKRKGLAAPQVLATELPKEVLGLYWAKNMYWRAGKPERFVRPIRWIVALLDAAIVPLEIAGITAGNVSRGHRILHGEAPVVIDQPRGYAEKLRAAKVIVDVAERRDSIRKALDAATRTVPGARWREDLELIETVVHLTEWPTVILGNFEKEYLELPEEVLVTVMRDHQKYFAVEGAKSVQRFGLVSYVSKLMPHFLAVLNIQVDEEGEAVIRHGNQKVLRARFKDARFFWKFDQKIFLADRVESLKNVTFHRDLGSYYWKTEQNIAVVKALFGRLPKDEMGLIKIKNRAVQVDENSLLLATNLAKADLTTELVKEFTELQGVIGSQYALAQGMSGVVAQPIYDQYKPASTEDEIPKTFEGQLLGIADRIQTITAMFGIGNAPTGSKDPFALRRAANSIVKILAESDLPLTLADVIASSGADGTNKDQVNIFFRERLNFFLKDVRGFAYDVVNAVLAAGADDVRDAIARAKALTEARESADFAAISAAFKRIKNILRQAEEKGFALGSPKDVTLAPEARQLADAAALLAPEVAALRKLRFYGQALEAIATLRPVVDAFFDKVMVLDPDPAIRGAHLGLINDVLSGFSGIADFSEIVTA
ncbi:MAG TPA: glycine--tRNA ligase subunit beta [Terracidiphilus sp.]